MAKKPSSRKKTSTSRKTSTTRGGTRSRRSSTSSRKSSSKRSTTRKKTTRKRTSSRKQSRVSLQQKVLFGGIGVVFLSAILALSLLAPSQGQLTTALTDLTFNLFGWGGWGIPFITLAIGIYLVFWGMDQPLELPTFRLLGVGILITIFEAVASLSVLLVNNGLHDVWTIAKAHQGGGYFGGLFTYALMNAVGTLGTVFTLVVAAVIGLILASGLTRDDMSYYLHEVVESIKNRPQRTPPSHDVVINTPRSRRSTALSEEAVATQAPLLPDPGAVPKREHKREPQVKKRPSRPTKLTPKPAAPLKGEPTILSPVFLGNSGRSKDHHWQIPSVIEMLEPGMDQDSSGNIIREQVEVIEHTLDSFGAPATVVEINQGPTITQFGVEPNYIQMRNGKRTKVKVGKIAGLADDLALALAAKSIRIQAPVPGKGYVGIEVPNPAKALVSLRDVMETAEFQKIARKSPMAIGLGQDVGGQPIAANLAAMPHLLIAGTTGSGKSVCVNGIIACLLLQNTPDTLKLVMVDPKRVELTGYNGIPHLAAPVIVEIDKVIGTLQWALREMDSRYKRFAELGARNIVDYNKKVRRHKKLESIPYIVIIIDELADLMMLSPEDTERSVTRLAQLARATGMHMVIATQRPSVDVVTGLIKANFPARVAFAVASGTDSRVILDATGAERLLGQGDMLYQSPDAAAPVRAQGCFVSEGESA
ncbi:MAG: DNA translocase FtsK 4TM domain-containing protein, partial [Anaerolineae bacterium]